MRYRGKPHAPQLPGALAVVAFFSAPHRRNVKEQMPFFVPPQKGEI